MFVLFRYGSQWFAIVPNFLIKTGNSALKTREKPYYGKNSRKALVSSIPLNIMEHVIADLLFIFRLQNLTQEVEIYYIGSVYSLFEIE
jgi:hypothetical protein